MTISYKWISEYIPVELDPEKVSRILTSIGLEVESVEAYENIPGKLAGLVVGEVVECRQHPGADKLKLTKVSIGQGELLQIVCGAPNVAAGQKVIVATIGTTIHPLKGEPLQMKAAKIRGEQSFGMICAEDEVGIGDSHDGIVVLPADARPGDAVANHYEVYTDWIYEIGLTPNRMDAMSHLGVARDICAYLSHHDKTNVSVRLPAVKQPETGDQSLTVEVEIENKNACRRYTGVSIKGIQVKPSPSWLQNKLKAIGQRPINNIVDITNYILHDTGQPLHAFDADRISGKRIVVKNLKEGTAFKALDERERKLSSEDLMICSGSGDALSIAGVFGGVESGVSSGTRNIFLESAWFNPIDIRKTSFRHGLRTDAAMRFEKNVDISQTLNVLQRAAMLTIEISGGQLASAFIDVYPSPAEKKEVTLSYPFLQKLSGKKYESTDVKRIVQALGFEVRREDETSLSLAVPYSKPDIELQADVVEEVMRIDGYDNIEIPSRISISPSIGAVNQHLRRQEKTADYLVGAGFSEIFTNSITNAAYFDGEGGSKMVKLLNNLSAVHNVMRPSMLETGLESISYNLNRKNTSLRFFEFGKTYRNEGTGKYSEEEHLCLYVTGSRNAASWKGKERASDVFYMKGVVEGILMSAGWREISWLQEQDSKLRSCIAVRNGSSLVAMVGSVAPAERARFDIRQEVYFADIRWQEVLAYAGAVQLHYTELPNQLPVSRDLAMIVPAELPYGAVDNAIRGMKLQRLRSLRLFDVFESEKLGPGKKSIAVNFTFQDAEKTLTDKEIDGMMTKIMRTLEQDLKAEIRKGAENLTS